MNYLISVTGPTAIGKTALAIRLAKWLNTEIISADSRQFFKEMSIGTAVPSCHELAQVPHHFIQHKSIFESYSVGDFERETIAFLTSFFQKKNCVIMVGGSGLYTDSVLKGLDVFPEIPAEIRQNLNEKFVKFGIEFLQNELQINDPKHFEKIDIQNPQRIIRALEVCYASGKPYSSFLNKTQCSRNFIPIEIALTAPRSLVYERINHRVEVMLEEGLLKEAQKLVPYKNLNALQTVGYRELFSFFNGEIPLETAIEQIKTNTRRFAKRQFTWFAKNKNIQWFDFQQNIEEIQQYIQFKMKQNES